MWEAESVELAAPAEFAIREVRREPHCRLSGRDNPNCLPGQSAKRNPTRGAVGNAPVNPS